MNGTMISLKPCQSVVSKWYLLISNDMKLSTGISASLNDRTVIGPSQAGHLFSWLEGGPRRADDGLIIQAGWDAFTFL